MRRAAGALPLDYGDPEVGTNVEFALTYHRSNLPINSRVHDGLATEVEWQVADEVRWVHEQ
jgi:hypothetical protein